MEQSNGGRCGFDIIETLKTTNLLYEENNWSETFLTHLDILRQTGMLCDVSVLVDGVKFRCHKIVLAAACPYFQALFHHDSNSQTRSELHLEGVSAVGFELILNFMYTSKLQITHESLIDLLEVADFLQYRDIVRVCCDILLQNITDENVLSLNQLAVAHLCQPLADATRDYILSNFSCIAQTKEFLSLSPGIMKDFVSSYKSFPPQYETDSHVIHKYLYQWSSQFDRHFVCEKSSENTQKVVDGMFESVAETSANENYLLQHTLDEIFKVFVSRLKDVEILVVVPGEASGKNETANKRSTRNILFYHPTCKRWLVLTELPFYNRMFYSVTTLANVLFVCGGEKKFDMPTRRAHAYSVDTNSWLPNVESMLKPRSNHSATTTRGLLFIVGGRGCSDNDLWNDGEVYDPKTGQWTLLPPLPGVTGLARCSFIPLGGQLYVFGGMESYVCKEVKERRVFRGALKYNTELQQWGNCPELALQLEEHKISVGVGDSFAWKGFILIIDEDRRGKKMKLYNPVTGKLSDFLSTNGQHRFGGYALMNDILYCTGGMVEYFDCHDLVHCTNLLEQSEWSFVTPLPCQLSHHFCVIMSKVLDEHCEE